MMPGMYLIVHRTVALGSIKSISIRSIHYHHDCFYLDGYPLEDSFECFMEEEHVDEEYLCLE